MMDRIIRSWEFAKVSYAILFRNTSLLLFPIISSISLVIVCLSFILPLWGMGFFEHMKNADDATAGKGFFTPLNLIVCFAFYFVNYFVIFFFNSALTACAVKAVESPDGTTSVADGLTIAIKRLPQIIAWALVSSVVGLLLQMVENAHEQAGKIVSAILGTAWSIVTYFVVPVIVIEGFGPYAAFKRSAFILKNTWGEGLVGSASLGLINFLCSIPILLICVALVFTAGSLAGTSGTVVGIAIAVIIFALFCAATSAAGVIFKAILYNYAANGRVPDGVDKAAFAGAFVAK